MKTFRSSVNQQQVSTVTYVVTNNSLVTLYDTAGNLLDVYSVEPGVKIKSVAVPSQPDDMVISILTDSDNLYQVKLQVVDLAEGSDELAQG